MLDQANDFDGDGKADVITGSRGGVWGTDIESLSTAAADDSVRSGSDSDVDGGETTAASPSPGATWTITVTYDVPSTTGTSEAFIDDLFSFGSNQMRDCVFDADGEREMNAPAAGGVNGNLSISADTLLVGEEIATDGIILLGTSDAHAPTDFHLV